MFLSRKMSFLIQLTHTMKVSVIIPVFNEEKTIAKILRLLTQSNEVDEIIVINDGSTDNSLFEIKKFEDKVKIISDSKNWGKGNALQQGLKKTSHEFVLFLDADLVGLKKSHLNQLKKSISKKSDDLIIGIVENAAQLVGPKLAMVPGGVRIFNKTSLDNKFVDRMPEFNHVVDLMITDYFKKEKKKVWFLKLSGLNHLGKTTKYGLKQGLKENARMYGQFAKAIPKLESWFELVKDNQIIDG